MYTRKQILKDYKINKYGIITSPGKFENEPIYTPYFYDIMLDGGSDEQIIEDDTNIQYDVFIVTPQDIKEFPELEKIKEVHLYYSDDGFVYCKRIKGLNG